MLRFGQGEELFGQGPRLDHVPEHDVRVRQTREGGEQLRGAPDVASQFASAAVDAFDGLGPVHETRRRTEHELEGQLLLVSVAGLG